MGLDEGVPVVLMPRELPVRLALLVDGLVPAEPSVGADEVVHTPMSARCWANARAVPERSTRWTVKVISSAVATDIDAFGCMCRNAVVRDSHASISAAIPAAENASPTRT